MATAKALTIGWVVRRASVTHLDDVIGEHSVGWLCLGAAPAALDVFAAPSRAGDHALTPHPIFRRQVERVCCLGWWLDRSAVVAPADQWCQRSHTLHKQKPRFVGGASGVRGHQRDSP